MRDDTRSSGGRPKLQHGVIAQQTSGRVLVMTPDLSNPVGGVRQHYRLVDALNAAGIPSAIVHHTPGFRCTWFQNTTQVVYRPSVNERDLIVVPEEWIGLLVSTAPGVPKAVFNQNAYTTFVWGTSIQETLAAYRHP